jgi:hypothetical protein
MRLATLVCDTESGKPSGVIIDRPPNTPFEPALLPFLSNGVALK